MPCLYPVFVLYNENKLVLGVIALFFVAEIVVMITSLVFVIPKQIFSAGCRILSAPKIFLAYWYVAPYKSASMADMLCEGYRPLVSRLSCSR